MARLFLQKDVSRPLIGSNYLQLSTLCEFTSKLKWRKMCTGIVVLLLLLLDILNDVVPVTWVIKLRMANDRTATNDEGRRKMHSLHESTLPVVTWRDKGNKYLHWQRWSPVEFRTGDLPNTKCECDRNRDIVKQWLSCFPRWYCTTLVMLMQLWSSTFHSVCTRGNTPVAAE
jgi:hypothetical protein